MAGLIVADRWGKPQAASFDNPTSNFKKGPPPSQMGDRFGNWAGRDNSVVTLPGGAVLQFDLSRLTLNDFRGMRDHYQINICQAMLMFLVHQLDWKIESTNQRHATQIEDNLREVWPSLMRGVAQSYWAGFSPMAMEVDNNPLTASIEVSKFKDLLPEECVVNWKQVDGYAPPGSWTKPKIHVFDGIKQRGMPIIPTDNAFWVPLLMESGDYYGKKLLRAAFPSWFFSVLLHLYSNRYFERFGEPVPVGRAPFDETVQIAGKSVGGREAMEQMLTSLRNRSVVVLPNDRQPKDLGGDFEWDISFLSSDMRGADFDRYLGRLDEEISLSMFTPLLMTRTSDVGSYNLGVQHLQSYLWMLNALASDLKVYLDKYVIDRLRVWNYGPRAPKAKFVFRSMGRENVEILKTIVNAGVTKGALTPDVKEISEATGITFNENAKLWEPLPPAAPADPGGPPQKDTRVERGRGSTTPADKPGVGGQRPTGRKVAASVAETVVRAFEEGTFGTGFHVDIPTIGGGLERRLETWVTDVADLGPHSFEGPQDFLSRLESVAEQEINELAPV